MGVSVCRKIAIRLPLISERRRPGSVAIGVNSSSSPRTIAVTSAARSPWPSTSQMNTPASVSDNGRTQKKSPPTMLGRLVPMTEAQPALFRGQTSWETRKILREKHLLNVARHFEVGFELRILNAQLLSVADKLLFGLLSRFLRSFATGDILHHALVI